MRRNYYKSSFGVNKVRWYMNLRSGRITNSNQPLPRRQRNNRMSNSNNQQGEQNSPQGTGTNMSTSIGTSSAIPSNAQSVASSTSNVATNGTSGMSTNNSILGNIGTTSHLGGFFPPSGTQTHFATPLQTRPPSFDGNRPRNPSYGMPTSFMAGLQTSTSNASPQLGSGSGTNQFLTNNQGSVGYSTLPVLTTENQMAFRQLMDDSNHNMIGVLAQTMQEIFAPIVQNVTVTNRENADNMSRIVDFFAPPERRRQNQALVRANVPIIEQIADDPPYRPIREGVNLGARAQRVDAPVIREEPQRGLIEPLARVERLEVPAFREEQPRRVVMVGRNQDADAVVHGIRNANILAENNLTTMIERIMAQNGLNTGIRRPNYASPIADYVMHTDLPRGYKVPQFTKFAGDTNESTVEHIARYLTEAGDIANNENLRIKYFPSFLTKNAFTWFTTLPPRSIDTWALLERLFHEQFYMEQSKISLKELASVKRKFTEPIDEYLNRFRLLKSRCFTVVPEHELVEMAAGGLDYSIRKKLDTQYLRDMAQLADRVRQVERLKAEKARAFKSNKKERISYVETEEVEDYPDFEEVEVDLAELKQAPPYSCKLLVPTKGKEIVENEKSDKFPMKVYTFDVTKCDEIFDLLVKDGQLIVPSNVKIPPLDQRKKRGFCKYHSFLGHKTSQCFLFRDLIQNAIKEGRLKFADKPKMKVDEDPLDVADTNYSEPSCIGEINMVEANQEATPLGEESTENRNCVLVEVNKGVTENIHKQLETSIEAASLAVSKEIQATEGQENQEQELIQATEGLRLKLERVKITKPNSPQKEVWDALGEPSGKFEYLVKYSAPESSKIPIEDVKPTGWGDDDTKGEEVDDHIPQKEVWDTLGEPSGKFDYLVKYSAPESSKIQIKDVKPSGWGDDDEKGEDVDVNMVDMERPRSEMEEMGRYLEKEKYKREDSYAADTSLKDYLMLCHKGNVEIILCPRCSIICNHRIAADFERKPRARTGINWRQDNQLFRCYPRAGESLLEFLVRCHKGATKCLICPRCSAAYDQNMAGAFEIIPFAPCWNHKQMGQMGQHFQGNHNQRKPDSPCPKGARRVTFRIPAEVPTDRWLQVKTNKGKDKWRVNE